MCARSLLFLLCKCMPLLISFLLWCKCVSILIFCCCCGGGDGSGGGGGGVCVCVCVCARAHALVRAQVYVNLFVCFLSQCSFSFFCSFFLLFV